MVRKPGRNNMTWSLYQVSFRLLSPIHIGWKKTGNLQQTRSYVTGRNLWGALTARLVRDHRGTNYHDIGKKVDEELRFSYFYPTAISDNDKIPDQVEIMPWNDFNEFSWLYLGSYSSTALNNKTADDGTLHETECIFPKTRDGDQVYLLGYVFEKTGCDLSWKNALKRIQFGGERGYGWGRVEIVNSPKQCDKYFEYDVDVTKESPIIIVPKDKCILAHTLADGLELLGEIEPFVGRDTIAKNDFGGNVSSANICWIPGGVVNEDKLFKIFPKGSWKEA